MSNRKYGHVATRTGLQWLLSPSYALALCGGKVHVQGYRPVRAACFAWVMIFCWFRQLYSTVQSTTPDTTGMAD